MTTKKTRPVKAKALPKRLQHRLATCAQYPSAGFDFSGRDCRAILAALAHEREAGRREGAHAANLRIFEGEQ